MIIPRAVIHHQHAEPRHIAGQQMQIAKAVIDKLRINGPDRLLDANGIKEQSLGKIFRLHPRSLRDDRGKQVHAAAAIHKIAARLGNHRQIKHVLDVIRFI